MQKITPFLWFDASDAREVISYYQSLFGESVTEVGSEKFDTERGSVQMATMTLLGITIRIMATAKHDAFNDSFSFEILCKDQAEIDQYWNAITKEGKEIQCGWCADKYGLRFQVVPENMGKLISTQEGMQKMFAMKKIVIADF